MIDQPGHVAASEVRLVGRVGRQVSERELPSGDSITVFSVVVDRAPRERHGKATVDTIACMTGSRAVRRLSLIHI